MAIFALGSMVSPAEEACQNLAKKKVTPILVNPRFVKPLDEDLIVELASRTRKILTVEEGVLKGGFGSAVLELLQERGVNDCRVKRLGLPEKFLEQGKRGELLSTYGLSRKGIVKAIDEIMRD
ncbi:1-deoxy-D-xylulose-5-phosphate synthase [subsurface metagenome]